jgi:hypothetical protein
MRLRTSWSIATAVFLLMISCRSKDTAPGALPPVITSFVAAKSTITRGTSTTLTAVFSNGTGNIDQGVGSVTSGQPVTISPQTDTTYILTVAGQGGKATSTTSVVVVPPTPPVIQSISFTDMYEGCSGNIQVNMQDPQSNDLTYVFQQLAGPQVQNAYSFGPRYTFVAPKVSKDESLTIAIKVTNSAGLKAEQTISATLKYSGPWTLDLKLNPMPASVLLNPNQMTITPLGNTSNANAWGMAGWGTLRYASAGDINEDGIEDMVIAGWNHLQGGGTTLSPPAQVFFLLSTANGYVLKEGKSLGIENVAGSNFPVIYDFNGDGKKDIFFPGYTDFPVFAVPSIMAIQQADGTFLNVPTVEKIASHSGDFVDFNKDGRPDLILANYGASTGGFPGMVYYENTGTGLKLHRTDGAPTTFVNLGGSSATAGDFHKTGAPTIINADTNNLAADHTLTLKNVVEISNFNWDINGNLANATQALFMTPFFNRDPRFARAFSAWGDMKSHNICTRALDLDGDGYQDFVMASMIWSGLFTNVEPDHSIINVVRGTATGFSDETEARLWNYQVTQRESHHLLRILDLNGDGRPDLIGSDEGDLDNGRFVPRSTGNEVLLNDGTGNLVSVFWEGFDTLQQKVHDITRTTETDSQVNFAPQRFFPLLGPNRELRWLTFVPHTKVDASGGYIYYLAWYLVDAGKVSSGPYMQDPAAWGVPGFSELYYLTHNPDVREMVMRGEYSSGLVHYLAQGKSEGRRIAY